jgi:hypothetical protein
MLIYLPLLAVLLIVVAIAAIANARRSELQRSDDLFGLLHDTYGREHGGRKEVKRATGAEMGRLTAGKLNGEQLCGFRQGWRSVREHFADDPKTGVVLADLLISDLIRNCEASESARERQMSHHALRQIRAKYRAAHDSAFRNEHAPGDPHQMERAMDLFGSIFEDLVGDSETTSPDTRS